MKFPRGTSQAQMAAATAALAANKPKFKSDMQAAATRGDVKQAVIPGRVGKPTFRSDQLRGNGTGNRMGAAANAANAAKQQGMARRAAALPKPMGGNMMSAQQIAAINKQGAAAGKAHLQNIGALGKPASGQQGLGSAMSGTKTGLGTAMGMKKMAGAGAALGKRLGMKSGGSVGSASKRADGIATKGKTKGRTC